LGKAIKVPDDLYDKLKEKADQEGKAIWEIIQESFETREEGLHEIKFPKPKFIVIQYPTQCIMCGKRLDPKKYEEETGKKLFGLWFPGTNAIVCLDCLIAKGFVENEQRKMIAKLEVEIRRLKAIKRELNEEINKYAMKISFYDLIEKYDTILDLIREAVIKIDNINPASDEVLELKNTLYGLMRKIEELEYPSKWVEKLFKRRGEETDLARELRKAEFKYRIRKGKRWWMKDEG